MRELIPSLAAPSAASGAIIVRRAVSAERGTHETAAGSRPPLPPNKIGPAATYPAACAASTIQFRCARNCRAAGYPMSLGTETRSRRYPSVGVRVSAERVSPSRAART